MKEPSSLKEEKLQPHASSFFNHFAASLMATTAAHIPRGMLNLAASNPDPLVVLKKGLLNWHKGLGWNLLRGGTVFGTQSFAKEQVQLKLGKETTEGKVGGVLASAFFGAVPATFLEPLFMRATYKSASTAHLPLMRFSPQLFFLFFTRETGFSAAVLCKKDLPPHIYYPLFATAVVLTAVCHKLATWDATADIMEAMNQKTPNLKRDGLSNSLNALARGGIYNHPACKPLYPNATEIPKLVKNLVFICAHPTMIVYRAFFIGVFTLAKQYSDEFTQDKMGDMWQKFNFLNKRANESVVEQQADSSYQKRR